MAEINRYVTRGIPPENVKIIGAGNVEIPALYFWVFSNFRFKRQKNQVMVFILLNDYTDKKAYKQTIKIICFKESYEYEMSILQ